MGWLIVSLAITVVPVTVDETEFPEAVKETPGTSAVNLIDGGVVEETTEAVTLAAFEASLISSAKSFKIVTVAVPPDATVIE